MSKPTQSITLDVVRNGTTRERVYLGEGDRNGTVLVANITENGKPFDCSEYTPYLMMPVGDLLYRQPGVANGTSVRVEVDESKLGSFNGFVSGAYISLETEDTATSTQRFCVNVEKAATGKSDLDESVTQRILDTLDSILERIEALESKHADDGVDDETDGDGPDDGTDGEADGDGDTIEDGGETIGD